jgi:hypothetical protein
VDGLLHLATCFSSNYMFANTEIPILFIFTGRRVCMLINGDYWMKIHAERKIEERRLVHVG